MPAGRMVLVPRRKRMLPKTPRKAVTRLQSDVKKLKRQVRHNTDVVVLDRSNTNINQEPTNAGRVEPNNYSWTQLFSNDNGFGHEKITIHCQRLNSCFSEESVGSEDLYLREGNKLWFKKINIKLSVIAPPTSAEITDLYPVVKYRYMLLYIPDIVNISNSTGAANVLFNDLDDINTFLRQQPSFKYRVLRKGAFSLSLSQLNANSPSIFNKTIKFKSKKGLETVYDTSNLVNPEPTRGSIYFIMMSQTPIVGAVPTIANLQGLYKYTARLIANE